MRVVIEEERRDVIVEDHEQNIGLLLGEPRANGLVGRKDGGPHWIVLFLFIERETDSGGVGAGNSSYDSCHEGSPTFDCSRSARVGVYSVTCTVADIPAWTKHRIGKSPALSNFALNVCPLPNNSENRPMPGIRTWCSMSSPLNQVTMV